MRLPWRLPFHSTWPTPQGDCILLGQDLKTLPDSSLTSKGAYIPIWPWDKRENTLEVAQLRRCCQSLPYRRALLISSIKSFQCARSTSARSSASCAFVHLRKALARRYFEKPCLPISSMKMSTIDRPVCWLATPSISQPKSVFATLTRVSLRRFAISGYITDFRNKETRFKKDATASNGEIQGDFIMRSRNLKRIV